MKKTYKTSVVTKPYTVSVGGWVVTVPVGAKVSNKTACGYDDDYRFWVDFREYAENLTGFKNSILHHHLTYYGVNIPKDYCQDYPQS